MARFYGKVGFVDGSVELKPGVWGEHVDERYYRGDILKAGLRTGYGENVNGKTSLTNRVSILADPYVYTNLGKIRYIEVNGVLWSVASIEIDRPRVIISLGGEYVDGQNHSA